MASVTIIAPKPGGKGGDYEHEPGKVYAPMPDGMEIAEGETKEVFCTVQREGEELCIKSIDGHDMPGAEPSEGEGQAEAPAGKNMAESLDDYVGGLTPPGGAA
jgi:hypothetical protein